MGSIPSDETVSKSQEVLAVRSLNRVLTPPFTIKLKTARRRKGIREASEILVKF